VPLSEQNVANQASDSSLSPAASTPHVDWKSVCNRPKQSSFFDDDDPDDLSTLVDLLDKRDSAPALAVENPQKNINPILSSARSDEISSDPPLFGPIWLSEVIEPFALSEKTEVGSHEDALLAQYIQEISMEGEEKDERVASILHSYNQQKRENVCTIYISPPLLPFTSIFQTFKSLLFFLGPYWPC
jgi:hypothetical protein